MFRHADLPTSDQVHKIQNGRISTGSVRSRLPHDSMLFTVGRRRQHHVAAVKAVRDIIQRIAPWVTAYVGPKLWQQNDADEPAEAHREALIGPNGEYGYLHGCAWRDDAIIYLSMLESMPDILSCCYHELFHICDPLLSDEAREAIDREIEQGRAYPSDYYRSAVERRARAFEHFAMFAEEGQTQFYLPPPTGSGGHSMNSVFLAIYRGDFALEIMRQREDLAA